MSTGHTVRTSQGASANSPGRSMNSAPAFSAGEVQGGSGEMFDAIAERYDFLNRVISLGIDRSWRERAVSALRLRPGDQVLDVATGTGDVAIATAQRLRRLAAASDEPQKPGAVGHIVGLDPAKRMLEIADKKKSRLKLEEISLQQGDGQNLPFEDDTFDGVSIAFGIRNVPDRMRALREMTRVTRPGGKVVVLELSEPEGGVLGTLARFHVRTLVPAVGAALSGSREYRYLQQSIAAFPPADEFVAMMKAAGLTQLEATPLTFGACHLFVGEVAAPTIGNPAKARPA